MMDGINIPNLAGYVSIKEAADILGVSDKRVYQYVMSGRLPAQKVGHILILPEEEVRRFKPGPSGRTRTKAPAWRTYRSRGKLLTTEINVQVRAGQQEKLIDKLKVIQKEGKHTFPGTVARYIIKGNDELTALQILLIWKDTEMPEEPTRQDDLAAFQEEMADVLDWRTAQYDTNEAIIHT
ncbi:hypothetical protein KSD_30130 [Ktedonobacter sp. SOSP1-85]|uniref:helix-turn-helix domain-containing protein n=1 Tax=Ktedonobacter sp. SOSP1-85 TaxID=2778367 RepID=UPI00191572DB|nr:helix-turn-helix domain-containing protein [Ktedonobacter sp. SOSP1-85]GHO75242.1 hypothetical protein KSD_30130 [Ktedonobacter sp. SOSP1-85]